METKGYGTEQFWGLCPGTEMPQSLSCSTTSSLTTIDCADLRYILSNLSELLKRYQNDTPENHKNHSKSENVAGNNELRLYIYERHPHILARMILKLYLLMRLYIMEHYEQRPLMERVGCCLSYLELHGNIRIGIASAVLLRRVSWEIIQILDCFQENLSGEELISKLDSLKRKFVKTGYNDENDFKLFCQTAKLFYENTDFKCMNYSDIIDIYVVFSQWISASSLLPKTNALNDESPTSRIITEAFDRRLRDFYGDRYDSRKNVCLWDKHFRLDGRLPYVHEIFFQSFRVDGLPMITQYYRQPNCLEVYYDEHDKNNNRIANSTVEKEPVQPVMRRAPTTAESQQFCGFANPSLMACDVKKKILYGYSGDITLGPWLETGVYIYPIFRPQRTILNPSTRFEEDLTQFAEAEIIAAKELDRTHEPAGPASAEPIFTSLEVSVVNLLNAARAFGLIWDKDAYPLSLSAERPPKFVPSQRLKLIKMDIIDRKNIRLEQNQQRNASDDATLILSIEGARFLETSEAFNQFPGNLMSRIMIETSGWIPQMSIDDVPRFTEKMETNLIKCANSICCPANTNKEAREFNKYDQKLDCEQKKPCIYRRTAPIAFFFASKNNAKYKEPTHLDLSL